MKETVISAKVIGSGESFRLEFAGEQIGGGDVHFKKISQEREGVK